MARPRRKKRTRIRTAAGTVQRTFLERVRALRDDPLRVLPECPHGEPRPVARVRSRLERIAAGKKVRFLDRRDKGVVGAVAHAVGLAELESVPRLVDQKMAGKRRFYLQRGHVRPQCSLGVQNHDDPVVLLAAWRDLAAEEGVHFFAGPALWCTGDRPRPPDAWWDALAQAVGLRLADAGEDPDRACPHPDAPRLRLRLPDGPALAVCGDCLGKAKDLHGAILARHAGPERRRPVAIDVVTVDGHEAPLESERIAAFRAGAVPGKALIREGLAGWRTQAAGGGAYILGQQHFDDQDAFLRALEDAGARPWELAALRVMTDDGYTGSKAAVDPILKDRRQRLPEGVAAVLGPDADATAFLAHQGKAGPRDVLRRAHEEAQQRATLARLPVSDALGPIGRWADRTARHARTHEPRETLDRLQKDAGQGAAPAHHVGAFIEALGGSAVGVAGAENHPPEWTRLAQDVLEKEGDDYRAALHAYLEKTGTGEAAT